MSQHPDDRINQVLESLRKAEAPGIEARIAQRLLEARTLDATDSRSPSTPIFVVLLNAVKDLRTSGIESRLYTAAGIALTLFLVISVITSFSRRAPGPLAHAVKPQISAQLNNPTRRTTVAQTLPIVQTEPNRYGTAIRRPLAPPTMPADPDAIALAETLAPSHPAPPMLLTQQERLMLSVLRSGDREEIAALDPAERDALFARDKAAFQEFFAPPPPATPTPAATTGDKE